MSILKKTALAAACVGSLLMAGGASAAGLGLLQIKGNVVGTCEFHNGPNTAYVMDFGNLDPSNTVPATADANVSYHCTNGTPASRLYIDAVVFGIPTGTSGITLPINSGANSLPVTLTWSVPSTPGTGFATAPMPLNVHGVISVAALNAAVAGAYTATYPMLILP